MKKIYALLVGVALTFSACSSNKGSSKTVTVGATPIPHAEILEFAKPLLEKEGYTLNIQVFNDYVIPNMAVFNGEIDANFFQHSPYLEQFNKDKNTDLVKTVSVHLEPIGIYSVKLNSIDELSNSDSIAIPNDPTNSNRALEVLQAAGIIKLNSEKEIRTKLDIIENPKNIEIVEIEAPQLPRTIGDFDLSVINTNFAIPAKLNPLKDALFLESKESPYANIVVVKKGNENKESIKALNKVLNSEEVRNFIREKYQGTIIEAF
ncbi:MAG: MetQ/NlpA family ABC transporter substrate-binding protein [Campylobacteraceae bacterium]|jgi:D-methionine transport system substrate-binding protein|nr:MetQ/NlpA family ABC transporter substrate-binding protein [Campylobacteraceae bacterium]